MSAAGTVKTGHSMKGQNMPPGLPSVRHLARHQVMGLASVFLLGMAVNLTGLPAETSGAAQGGLLPSTPEASSAPMGHRIP